MKIFVKTLKGTHFDIEVKPQDSVVDVKKNIETVQGPDVYPAAQQMLIHQGKVLKDNTTLEENKVAENSFVVIMLTKVRLVLIPKTESDVYGEAASNLVAGNNLEGAIQQILDMGGGTWDRDIVIRALRAAYNNPERAVEYLYSQCCSILLKYAIMHSASLDEMIHAGIPEQAEVPPVARVPGSAQTANPPAQSPQPTQPAPVTSNGPNANPLDLFPQGLPDMGSGAAGAGSLDFLRNSQQVHLSLSLSSVCFQILRAMVQANPQILQPMLQELGKQNPQLMRLIQDHQADFLRLINEPVEGGEGNIGSQLAAAMPQSVTVTPEEREAIERLEAMGFDRAIVLEVFFACNKNEELAANYLLDHMHEFED
ncbi:hypothetical protein JRO89_XS05G0007100 [Xanthoceras sorbifolium]|uniref:Ubiquitin receptor RAD23 n=1 Tax=Xanthoceras sorbifolium TaxID=99658 RepID=A0ABQ8HZN9_9ROSI|nr:hypothetical protein JRO89_XS05G0007100 [Xanthoceras sorbifolium]